MLSTEGTYYVDPFYHLEADGPYVSYFKTDVLRDPQDNFSCFVQDIGIENAHEHDTEDQHAGGCCCPDCAITVSAGSDLQADSVTRGLSTM